MFASRNGELIRELVADSQGDPKVAEDFRNRFFAHRRARGAATLERGVSRGELRSDLNVERALDVLYGPLWLRLLIPHASLSPAAADQILELVWPSPSGVSVAFDKGPRDSAPTGHRKASRKGDQAKRATQ
jgi:hypothetical protein